MFWAFKFDLAFFVFENSKTKPVGKIKQKMAFVLFLDRNLKLSTSFPAQTFFFYYHETNYRINTF